MVPAAQPLIVLATDKVRADVEVVDEPKASVAPDRARPLGVGVEAVEAHETADHRQLGPRAK